MAGSTHLYATLGLARLNRKLKKIPIAAADQIREAMLESGLEIAALAKSLAPIDKGDLRDSIGACIGDPPPTSATGAFRPRKTYGSSLNSKVTVYAGDDVAYYARWVEFGTQAAAAQPSRRNANYKRILVMTKALSAHHATQAQPFFYPAYRALKRRVKTNVNKAVRKAAQITAALS
jgi:HK97 gp10 family phage protein